MIKKHFNLMTHKNNYELKIILYQNYRNFIILPTGGFRIFMVPAHFHTFACTLFARTWWCLKERVARIRWSFAQNEISALSVSTTTSSRAPPGHPYTSEEQSFARNFWIVQKMKESQNFRIFQEFSFKSSFVTKYFLATTSLSCNAMVWL